MDDLKYFSEQTANKFYEHPTRLLTAVNFLSKPFAFPNRTKINVHA